ncbi:O-antigen ligase family protein [Spongiivirga sp. MCCC 1A20706]|uniref:O-antigen ligase family protein n=1 Tax=Spongiivirga sp. MCCC 1A20706 TaxID=3160963 RepID=UPI003977767B
MLKDYNVNEILLGLTLFSLPISTALNSVFLVLFFLYNLFYRIKHRSFKDMIYYSPAYIIFFIHLIGYFVSEYREDAAKKAVLFLSFFFLPFLFQPIGKIIKIEKMILYLFYGILLITIYAFGRSVYDILILDVRYDYGRGVDLLLNYTPHHTYLSMYILSVILGISYLIGEKKVTYHLSISLPFLYLMIFLLPSRTAIILALTIVPFFIFNFLKNRFDKTKMVTVLLLSFALLVILGFSIDYTRDKMVYAFYEVFNISTKEKPFYGISRRRIVWNTCLNLIEKAPFLGYGIGDVQHILDTTYIANEHFELKKINAHNQYLQNILNYGVFFSTIFAGIIIWVLAKLVKRKESLLISIWIVIITISFTESILQRQWGVVFFSIILIMSLYRINLNKIHY